MWLQHRGKWSVTSEATGEKVELEFGCFGGAASGEFAAALREEADEAARLLLRERSGEGEASAEEASVSASSTSDSSSSSSCAESFETVGFASGVTLSERDKAVAAKRRALREVRGRLVSPSSSNSSSSSSHAATGITLAGAWDSGLVIIDNSAGGEREEEEERRGGGASCSSSSSTSSASASAAPALGKSSQGQRTRKQRRSIIWTAAVDATSPVARGDNRYCMSRWTLALNEEDGAAEAAATRAAAVVSPGATPRFGTLNTSSAPSPFSAAAAPHHHDSLPSPSAVAVAFRAPPATDSRRRPDLRAVEHGDWEAASAARDALLAAQACRAAATAADASASSSSAEGGGGGKHLPAWFRVRDCDAKAGEAFMFEYAGGYWADRKRRAAEDEAERRRTRKEAEEAARDGADGENNDDDDFFDAQEAPF